MDRVPFIICLFIGVFFAYISIPVFGYGAAIAIPSDVLLPFATYFPIVTLATIDLITQGLPLCIIYCILALIIKHFNLSNRWYYLVLSVPFYILHSYLFSMQLPTQDLVYLLAILLPKYIALALCILYFINQSLENKKTKLTNQ